MHASPFPYIDRYYIQLFWKLKNNIDIKGKAIVNAYAPARPVFIKENKKKN